MTLLGIIGGLIVVVLVGDVISLRERVATLERRPLSLDVATFVIGDVVRDVGRLESRVQALESRVGDLKWQADLRD